MHSVSRQQVEESFNMRSDCSGTQRTAVRTGLGNKALNIQVISQYFG